MAEKKYINAQKYINHLTNNWKVALHSLNDFAEHFIHGLLPFIKWKHTQPAADVAEVRHGHWKDNMYYKMDADGGEIFCQDEDYVCCSECNFSLNKLDNCTEEFAYCPYCGARMDGDSNA